MQHQTSFPWVKKIAEKIALSIEIPLFGNAPAFAWDRFSALVSSRFGVHDLQILEIKREWIDSKKLQKNHITQVRIDPIGDGIYWIMAESESQKLSSHLLKGKARSSSLNKDLAAGFYQYLLLQACDCLHSIDPFNHFSIQLNFDSTLLEDNFFAVDVEIMVDHKPCFATIAIAPNFHKNWLHHFSKTPTSFPKHGLKVDLPISIEIGSVELTAEEWANASIGDAIVLDQSSFDPRKQLGIASLTYQGINLFHARVKHQKIELIDAASIHEVHMTKKTKEPHALEKTPVVVTVELGKIQMTLEKLMQLQVGNFLELPIHPEQLVSLTVNGETVAKAELVYLGETLSARIVSL